MEGQVATALANRAWVERVASVEPAPPAGVAPGAARGSTPTPEPAETLPAAGAPVDEGEAPEWPDEAVESAMRAEQQERDGPNGAVVAPSASRVPAKAAEEEPAGPLPKLDVVVAQIPPEVRETLEELFRARFTSVQRVPKTVLKS